MSTGAQQPGCASPIPVLLPFPGVGDGGVDNLDQAGGGGASGRKARRFWSPAEDEALRRMVRTVGAKNWKHIAQFLPGRTSKQCRERWTNQANPAINHGDFTAEEDEAIIRLKQGATGSAWAKIREQLPGYSAECFRTDNQVKNRWYATLRRVVEVR